MRIPLKAAVQSVGKLPLNPREACHLIHDKVATESTGKLPPNPRQGCHPWQVPPAPIGAKRRDAGLDPFYSETASVVNFAFRFRIDSPLSTKYQRFQGVDAAPL